MSSALRGRSTSAVEVTNIFRHGLWLLVGPRELFLPFTKFPWFKNAELSKILNVELPHPDHLYWPELDVDLSMESIEHPQKFPLVSKARPNNALQRTRATTRGRKR